MAAVIERSAQVIGRYQLEQALAQVPAGIETHVICLSSGNGSGLLDFANIVRWIDDGYSAADAYLRYALPHLNSSVTGAAARGGGFGRVGRG
jgi:hypothetical protein